MPFTSIHYIFTVWLIYFIILSLCLSVSLYHLSIHPSNDLYAFLLNYWSHCTSSPITTSA